MNSWSIISRLAILSMIPVLSKMLYRKKNKPSRKNLFMDRLNVITCL